MPPGSPIQRQKASNQGLWCVKNSSLDLGVFLVARICMPWYLLTYRNLNLGAWMCKGILVQGVLAYGKRN